MNLTEILKKAPSGTELYSTVHGIVYFENISRSEEYPIIIKVKGNDSVTLTKDGRLYYSYKGSECILFPSKDNRNWNTFQIDLPKLTPCFVSDNFESTKNPANMLFRYYETKGNIFVGGEKEGDTISFDYIIPCNKYIHETNSFKEEDNYGTRSNKKW